VHGILGGGAGVLGVEWGRGGILSVISRFDPLLFWGVLKCGFPSTPAIPSLQVYWLIRFAHFPWCTPCLSKSGLQLVRIYVNKTRNPSIVAVH